MQQNRIGDVLIFSSEGQRYRSTPSKPSRKWRIYL